MGPSEDDTDCAIAAARAQAVPGKAKNSSEAAALVGKETKSAIKAAGQAACAAAIAEEIKNASSTTAPPRSSKMTSPAATAAIKPPRDGKLTTPPWQCRRGPSPSSEKYGGPGLLCDACNVSMRIRPTVCCRTCNKLYHPVCAGYEPPARRYPPPSWICPICPGGERGSDDPKVHPLFQGKGKRVAGSQPWCPICLQDNRAPGSRHSDITGEKCRGCGLKAHTHCLAKLNRERDGSWPCHECQRRRDTVVSGSPISLRLQDAEADGGWKVKSKSRSKSTSTSVSAPLGSNLNRASSSSSLPKESRGSKTGGRGRPRSPAKKAPATGTATAKTAAKSPPKPGKKLSTNSKARSSPSHKPKPERDHRLQASRAPSAAGWKPSSISTAVAATEPGAVGNNHSPGSPSRPPPVIFPLDVAQANTKVFSSNGSVRHRKGAAAAAARIAASGTSAAALPNGVTAQPKPSRGKPQRLAAAATPTTAGETSGSSLAAAASSSGSKKRRRDDDDDADGDDDGDADDDNNNADGTRTASLAGGGGGSRGGGGEGSNKRRKMEAVDRQGSTPRAQLAAAAAAAAGPAAGAAAGGATKAVRRVRRQARTATTTKTTTTTTTRAAAGGSVGGGGGGGFGGGAVGARAATRSTGVLMCQNCKKGGRPRSGKTCVRCKGWWHDAAHCSGANACPGTGEWVGGWHCRGCLCSWEKDLKDRAATVVEAWKEHEGRRERNAAAVEAAKKAAVDESVEASRHGFLVGTVEVVSAINILQVSVCACVCVPVRPYDSINEMDC